MTATTATHDSARSNPEDTRAGGPALSPVAEQAALLVEALVLWARSLQRTAPPAPPEPPDNVRGDSSGRGHRQTPSPTADESSGPDRGGHEPHRGSSSGGAVRCTGCPVCRTMTVAAAMWPQLRDHVTATLGELLQTQSDTPPHSAARPDPVRIPVDD